MSAHTKDRSSLDGAFDMFVTAPDTAVFWSGRTKAVGGADRAAEIARATRGTTLEMLLAERHIMMPAWDGTEKTLEAWRKASAHFAAAASGTVRVVLGERVRDDAIWAATELPVLLKNDRVARIMAIDPATLKETTLYDRAADTARSQATADQDAKARETDRHAAQAFMSERRESAIERHPLLDGAYAMMRVIEQHIRTSELTDDQRALVLAAARESIARSIQNGRYPEIKIRDKSAAPHKHEHSYER